MKRNHTICFHTAFLYLFREPVEEETYKNSICNSYVVFSSNFNHFDVIVFLFIVFICCFFFFLFFYSSIEWMPINTIKSFFHINLTLCSSINTQKKMSFRHFFRLPSGIVFCLFSSSSALSSSTSSGFYVLFFPSGERFVAKVKKKWNKKRKQWRRDNLLSNSLLWIDFNGFNKLVVSFIEGLNMAVWIKNE